jgi:ABC-type transporter Mla MlaB component
MLRITTTHCDQATRTFKLEGKLLGPWIGELVSAYSTSQVSPDRVRLDLHGLTFVDAEGARFLASLIHDGARVIACSGFVAEMLQLEVP